MPARHFSLMWIVSVACQRLLDWRPPPPVPRPAVDCIPYIFLPNRFNNPLAGTARRGCCWCSNKGRKGAWRELCLSPCHGDPAVVFRVNWRTCQRFSDGVFVVWYGKRARRELERGYRVITRTERTCYCFELLNGLGSAVGRILGTVRLLTGVIR